MPSFPCGIGGRRGVLLFLVCCTLASLPRMPQAGGQATDKFPPELVRFTSYKSNPVFQAAGPGHWDVKIRERGWIVREPGLYKLWYTGYDGSKDGPRLLGYATSPDGIRWTRHPGNPLLKHEWVEDMMVVKHAGKYYMFAEGKNDRAHLLVSTDGVTWNARGRLDVRQKDGTPIADGPYGTPPPGMKTACGTSSTSAATSASGSPLPGT